MKPVLNESGGLETRVVTYFPPGAAVLLRRLADDELEIQLGIVDQAGGFSPIRHQAHQPQQTGGKRVDGAHAEAVRSPYFQGFVGAQRRLSLFKYAAQILRRLRGHAFRKGDKRGELHKGQGTNSPTTYQAEDAQ